MEAIESRQSEIKSSPRNSSYSTYMFVGILVLSVALNLALALQLREARNNIVKLKSEMNLRVGEKLPDIEARNVNGIADSYSYSADPRPTILYVFSPTCGWCTKNSENMRYLYHQKSLQFRFVGISTSSKNLKDYLLKQNLDYPVFTDLSADTVMKLKIGGTPQTIVVSEEGTVIKNWVGAYMNEVQTDVENFFDLKLPGITN